MHWGQERLHTEAVSTETEKGWAKTTALLLILLDKNPACIAA
jgi:hypothetical protein